MWTRQRPIIASAIVMLALLAPAASAAQAPQTPPGGAGTRARAESRQGQARGSQQADRLEIAELQRLLTRTR
jgi:hypothetical protein